MDPRIRARGTVLGGLLVAIAVLTGCAHAHAALPRTQQVAVTGEASPRRCGAAVRPGTTTVPVPVDGVGRLVRLYVPHAYRPDRRLPLVLNLHGTGSSAARQESGTGMDATADVHGFLVAYPEGLHRSGTGFGWNIPGTPTYLPHGPDELTYLDRLIALLQERYCADLHRVYAVGFSGGGRMVSQLACQPGRELAAVAAVGGLRAPSPCAAPPVPVLGVHGTADPQNPYEGHGQPYWTYSVPEAARRWAVQDGCGAAPTVNRTSPGVTLTTYHGCRGAGAVLLYTLTGRGHVWPSARSGFDCDETVWRFFAEHSRQVADRIPTAD